MSVSRKRAWPYAEQLLSRPARRVPVVLRHGKGGVTLLHRGRALTRCYANATGAVAAEFMADALGVSLPPVGGSVDSTVSTGVLYRAIFISSLDLRIPEVRPLLERLLDEAAEQRSQGAEESV